MVSNNLRSRCARTACVWRACACVCVFLWAGVAAFAEPIACYDSWQWNGARRTYSPVTASSASSVTSSSLLSSSTVARSTATASSTGTASLSGVVYWDENGSLSRDATDWGVYQAHLQLTVSGSDTTYDVYTTSDGSYSFENLPTGVYTITLLTVCPDPGVTSVGTLTNGDEVLPASESGTVSSSSVISDITLGEGYVGTDYDFGQLSYPTELISKRLLLNTQPGIRHTTPTPEPGTLTIACMMGLAFIGLRRRLWSKPQA